MPHSTEALDTHMRPLAPLSPGDKIFLQNQRGSHPKQWDNSGTVVELGNYDQYWVKVYSSGRLSSRNRRFLRKFVPPSLTKYWRSPVPLAPAVLPSNQGFITTNTQRVSPNDDFTSTARTPTERRVTNTALGTTHRCSVCASPRLDRGGADRPQRLRRDPPHQLHRLRYLHQYQPNHPSLFAQDDSLNHVATTYQKRGNGKNVDVRGALILDYIPGSMIVISLERGGDVVVCLR